MKKKSKKHDKISKKNLKSKKHDKSRKNLK